LVYDQNLWKICLIILLFPEVGLFLEVGQGVVHASVGQTVTPLTSSQGYVAVHFLHTETLTDKSQVVRPQKSTNNLPYTITIMAEQGPSRGMDSMNPHCQSGGWPCAFCSKASVERFSCC
jgi:hypothetical protein